MDTKKPDTSGRTWWTRRTKMERCLLLSVAFLTVIAIVLITTTTMAMARPKGWRPVAQELSAEVCNSTVCHERAQLILQSMDVSVDPCQDFYGYVCNNWMRNNPIPDERARFSKFDRLRLKVLHQLKEIFETASYKVEDQNVTDQVVLAYHCCVNESINEDTKYAALRTMLSGVGIGEWPRPIGWPDAPSWEDLFVRAHINTGLSFIMAAGVGVDLKNTSLYVITFDQPMFGIGRNQLLNMSTPNNEPIVRAYKNYMAGTIRFMKPSLSEREIAALIEDIIGFEAQLAKRTRSPEDRRVFDTMYNRRTIANLSAEFPQVDWLDILNRLFEPVNLTFTDEEDVVMREPEYYNSTLDFLNTVERSTIYNYVGWRLMQNFGPTSSKLLRNLEFEFVRVVQGVEKILPIWQRCLGSIGVLLDHPTGRLYIDKQFSPQAKEDMDSLVSDLKVAFSALLQQNDWMDGYTKDQAANKLNAIVDNIAYPSWLKNNTYLNSRYDHVKKILPGTPYLNVYLNVRYNGMLKGLKKLRRTFNRSEEYVGSAVVNAFYNRVANSIAFPAGILQSPFYGYGLPPSVNMGAIGSIIGHEITHGFDDAGSQFDFEGNLRNWWTHITRQKFLDRAKCFIEQYGSIVDPQADMNLNGINTQGENIADNGGIREAFRAYRISLAKLGKPTGIALPGLESFTSDQMFFISTATAWCTNMRTQELKNDIQYDTHSPSRYRVNIPMGNLVEFSHAFGCPEGTPMNLTKKCILW
ncbi:neprilysin-1-like isoform X1 [Haemaphysalis longicornis]